MNILTIMGTPHKGNTRAVTELFLAEFAGEGDTLDEIILPKDFGEPCLGCAGCILNGEDKCPHREKLAPLLAKLEKADLIILATPVFVMSCSSGMKEFLDHLAFMWLVHRPREEMFGKVGLIITTAGGSGVKDTVKLLRKNLNYLGVSQVFDHSVTTMKMGGNYAEYAGKDKIKKQVAGKARRVLKAVARPRVSFGTRFLFGLFGMTQKKGWNKTDSDYWRGKGWLDGKKPF